MRYVIGCVLFVSTLGGCKPNEMGGGRSPALAAAVGVQRALFVSGGRSLELEFLGDDLLHFQISGVGPPPAATDAIAITPQVLKTDYTGPTMFVRDGNTFRTSELQVVVAEPSLCLSLTDTARQVELTTICPLDLGQVGQRLSIARGVMQNAYGLGEEFWPGADPDGDWIGRVRSSPDRLGNKMAPYNDGSDANVQLPVLYALGPGSSNYGLFVDHIYTQTWDFTAEPWLLRTEGDAIRGYVMTGADLPDLRTDYMDLVGHPIVPPKQLFGVWVSEFGYDDWTEIDGKLETLRAHAFPVDGFVLDVQWFGGVAGDSDASNMGRLTWDAGHFPEPAAKLASYAADGIGIIPIEQSYVGKSLAEHADLEGRGFLIRQCAGCVPVYLSSNPWWGKGGMIDWTEGAAGDYWHDQKRQPLIADGVLGHWLALGEPEAYDANDWASGVLVGKHAHADYHNMYNFEWARSVARGYARNLVTRRPFILARSGAAGIQRFGVALWSGDIASRMGSLRAHLNAQMHMSLSGIDYFGSDVGGFARDRLDSDLDDLYTRWLANSLWIDLPVRPHTNNSDPRQPRETAPDRVGNSVTNLANIRQRYELVPYLYSLAHRAYTHGEPFAPPVVQYYQNDLNVRRLGSEKLVGRDVLVACITNVAPPAPEPRGSDRGVYLPAGDWVNYHTGQWFHSSGQLYGGQPLWVDGILRVPVYVRAGAILPKMYVDAQTQNALGRRADGTTRNELIVRAVTAARETHFTLYEDDGTTIAYQGGAVRQTLLSQNTSGSESIVTIGAATGAYEGAPSSRDNVVELVTDGRRAISVHLNGAALKAFARCAELDSTPSGWCNLGRGVVRAKSGNQGVNRPKVFSFATETDPKVAAHFVCDGLASKAGESVYVVGNVPVLGNWQPDKGVKLEPNGPFPRWTRTLEDLPPNASIEWNCVKRSDTTPSSSKIELQSARKNHFTTPAFGHIGTIFGTFSP